MSTAARRPLPPPTLGEVRVRTCPQIPRRLSQGRLRVLNSIEAAFAADAQEAVRELVDQGWSPEQAARATRDWIVMLIEDAVALGVGRQMLEGY